MKHPVQFLVREWRCWNLEGMEVVWIMGRELAWGADWRSEGGVRTKDGVEVVSGLGSGVVSRLGLAYGLGRNCGGGVQTGEKVGVAWGNSKHWPATYAS